MTLPASGAISLNNVNVELGFSGTASINMGSADVRGLFGVASGAIAMSDGYGKSSYTGMVAIRCNLYYRRWGLQQATRLRALERLAS
jgi:hypothetical protein